LFSTNRNGEAAAFVRTTEQYIEQPHTSSPRQNNSPLRMCLARPGADLSLAK
jgi:hypothetical protein